MGLVNIVEDVEWRQRDQGRPILTEVIEGILMTIVTMVLLTAATTRLGALEDHDDGEDYENGWHFEHEDNN